MQSTFYRIALSALALTLGCSLAQAQTPAAAGRDHGRPEIIAASHQDVLPSLSKVAHKHIDPNWRKEANPKKRVPYQDPPVEVADLAAQTAPLASVAPAAATSSGLGIDGIGQGFVGVGGKTFTVQSAPPDTTGAVGATQYVQWVNSAFAVFDKATGAVVYGPAAGNTLFTGFGGRCEATNDGDPVVMYDKAAGRWVMMQFAVTNGATAGYFQCVAVSQTSDATGAWNRYAFQYTGFNDYPKAGVWPDGYYVAYNIFNGGTTFAGAKVCAFDRQQMLAGLPATQQCFQLSTAYGGLLPADLDGSTPPAAGTPNFFANLSTNKLNLWKFSVNWATPASSTFTGPTAVPVTAFTAACNGGTCIPQSGTGNKLDSLADRLMFRLAYRKFPSYESLLVNHAVKNGTSNVGVRWYELRNPSAAAPTVYQQSTYTPDTSAYRWMGSMAMDKQGNIALAYSASGSKLKPSLRYATRLAADPLNTLSNETVIIQGAGVQTGSLSRWGDYSTMTIDPVDDCTFWFTSEYLKANGTFNWSTRIKSFKIAGCV